MAIKLKAQLAQYEEIKKIMDHAEEVENGEPLDADRRSRPFAPASEAEIKSFEKKLGYGLPPSYREFLRIHNGWQCFWGATWIAGVSGKSLSCVRGRLRESKKLLKSYAEWDPSRDLVLGADDNGGFLVFDSKADKKGERKVLDCPRGFAENTFDSFAHLLEVQLRCRAKEIAKLPKALRTLPASSQAQRRKDGSSRKFAEKTKKGYREVRAN